MKKFKENFLKSLPIIFVVLVIITFILIFNMQAKVDEKILNSTTDNKVNEEDNIVQEQLENENIVDDNNQDVIENEIENEVTNTISNSTSTSNVTINQNVITEDEFKEISTIDNKEKAVELVKDKYDNGDGTIFFCDSVLNSGEFVVAAKAPNSSTISAYYKVDLNTKNIDIIY